MSRNIKSLPFGVREVPTSRRWVGSIDPASLTIAPDGRIGQLVENADGERVVLVPVLDEAA